MCDKKTNKGLITYSAMLILGIILCCQNVLAYEKPQRLTNHFESVEAYNDYRPTSLKLYSDGLPISLKDGLFLHHDTLLISTRDLSKNFPFEIRLQRDGNTLTSFYNNNFIKCNVGSRSIYINGRAQRLKVPVARLGDAIYLPLEFFFQANDYTTHYVNNDIYLNPRIFKKLSLREGTQYLYTEIDKYDLAFFIPTHWKQIKGDIYGVWNEYSQYRLKIDRVKLSADQTLETFVQSMKQEISAQLGEIVFYEENRLNIGANSFEHFKYENIDEQLSISNDVYITRFKNELFVFEFQFNRENQAFISKEFYSILSSVHKTNTFVNPLEEHYYEYDDFHNYQIRLDKPLYSNMNVNGTLDLSGSIRTPATARFSLYLIVEKKKDLLEFDIPLEKTSSERAYFHTKLYSPFGLGKHNIHIYAKSTDAANGRSENKSLLKFSTVNLSNAISKYLIPTRYVISNSMIAGSLASILTVDATNDFEKVDSVFRHMTTQIQLKEKPGDKIEHSDHVIEHKLGTSLELNIATCAVLRNLGIPSKIYVGEFKGNRVYFTEYEINGKNKILDPVSQILYNQNRRSEIKIGAPFNAYPNFSNLDADQYKSFLRGFRLLNY